MPAPIDPMLDRDDLTLGQKLLLAILGLLAFLAFCWMAGEAWDYQWERCDQWQQELREKIEEQGDDWYTVMYGEEEEEER